MNGFAALADPTRRGIVELLGTGERAAGEIAAEFAMTPPAVSQHLKVLREAGLVRVRAEGQRRIYSLDREGWEEVEEWAGEIAAEFAMTPPAVSQHLKVLREAGLVRVRAEGQRRIYSLDREGWEEVEDAQGRQILEGKARRAGERVEQGGGNGAGNTREGAR
jgi:DNA-binding transcriptional ArsR family regulator